MFVTQIIFAYGECDSVNIKLPDAITKISWSLWLPIVWCSWPMSRLLSGMALCRVIVSVRHAQPTQLLLCMSQNTTKDYPQIILLNWSLLSEYEDIFFRSTCYVPYSSCFIWRYYISTLDKCATAYSGWLWRLCPWQKTQYQHFSIWKPTS